MGDIFDEAAYRSPVKHKMHNVSISDQLQVDFERLRVSALTKAAEISPLVKNVTIGPKSPIKNGYDEAVEVHPKQEKVEENLIEDRVSDDLRYSLMIRQYEKNLQESSEVLFRNLVDNMLARRADSMRSYWSKQSEQCERRARELKERKLQLLHDLHENDNRTVLERARRDQQNSRAINTHTLENMNRILEEQNKATARFASVTDSHTKICICYNEITDIVQKDPQGKAVSDKHLPALKLVLGNISVIMDLCKTGALSDKEVKEAEILALNIDDVRKKIVEELSDIKKQELIKKQEEEENLKKKKELEEKRAQETKAAEIAQIEKSLAEQSQKSQPLFYSATNYNYFQELKSFLDLYENQYKDLLANVSLKKFRFDCQKAVNTPVNALSSVSGVHIRDKYDKLAKLLKGERVQVLDTYVTAAEHPQGLQYCTALLAKKIVRQGDLLVSSNTEAAFPLAAVTAALWSQFPEFGKLLEAYFHRLCPYLVPMFLPQKEGQTDKEFYLSRGYTYTDEVVEKQDKFLKRMSGIFKLRCAIWIAKTPRFLNTPNPHGPRFGWQWLASFVNLKPEPDISATLLHDFFNICGSEFHKLYGKQFVKIIKLISLDYLAILQNIDEGGPKTRLEVFLQQVLKTGVIQPPSGLLPPNTW